MQTDDVFAVKFYSVLFGEMADIHALLCFGAVAGLLHIFEFFYLKRQRRGKEADGGLPPRNFPLIAVLADLYAFCNIWFWLG